MIVERLPEHLREDAVSLWQDAGLTRPWNDPRADLDRALGSASSTVLAAVEDGRLTGTAMVGHDGHRGWVYYVAVHPARRGQGLGRELMAAAEEWVAERGIPKMQLMVRTTNPGTREFYERMGYAVQDTVVLGKFFDPERQAQQSG
ncbi:GNAT family acetyltransferase [Kocuria sp. M4R2S49]|uniref:GNAT family acetyltransferase n=1 Tax=Kocuria rhizosphaericola TaxID=3376284 RepID=UPI00378EECC2